MAANKFFDMKLFGKIFKYNFLNIFGYQFDQLLIRDFKSRFAGSSLGAFWSILQPLAMMTTLSIVFTFGLRGQGPKGLPFVVWFFPASIAWNFFAEGVGTTSGVFFEYSYLVKKFAFRLVTLPLVKVVSILSIHVFFLIIVLAINLFFGVSFSILTLQVIYFTFCLSILVFSIGIGLASINVFWKDLGQLIQIVIQFGFWVTPIVWTYDRLPQKIQWLLVFNPMFYITEGYRSALTYALPFWESDFHTIVGSPLVPTIVFWVEITFFGYCSKRIYSRLRPHFADVI